MKEHETSESPITGEQIRQNLLDHLKDAEFGSVTFQASSDYFALNYHRNLLGIELDNILSAGRDQKQKAYWESETRIREMQIALLEYEIESSKSKVPGYSKAYMKLVLSFDDLAMVANREAEKKYPTDKEKREIYSDEVYTNIYNEASNLVLTRQDNS